MSKKSVNSLEMIGAALAAAGVVAGAVFLYKKNSDGEPVMAAPAPSGVPNVPAVFPGTVAGAAPAPAFSVANGGLSYYGGGWTEWARQRGYLSTSGGAGSSPTSTSTAGTASGAAPAFGIRYGSNY